MSYTTAEPRTTTRAGGTSNPLGICAEVLGGLRNVYVAHDCPVEAGHPPGRVHTTHMPVGGTLASVGVCVTFETPNHRLGPPQ